MNFWTLPLAHSVTGHIQSSASSVLREKSGESAVPLPLHVYCLLGASSHPKARECTEPAWPSPLLSSEESSEGLIPVPHRSHSVTGNFSVHYSAEMFPPLLTKLQSLWLYLTLKTAGDISSAQSPWLLFSVSAPQMMPLEAVCPF